MMTERQHLAEARAAWEAGLATIVEFGRIVLSRVGFEFDPSSLEVALCDRRRQRQYKQFLVPQGDDDPFPFNPEMQLVGPAADSLAVSYHRLVKHLRPLEHYFELLPGVELEGDVSGCWEEPEPVYRVDDINPWMLLGVGNHGGFSKANAIVNYLHSFMLVRGRGRESPDWIVGRLSVMRKHVADWRGTFTNIERHLPPQTAPAASPLTVNVEQLWAQMHGEIISLHSKVEALFLLKLTERPGQWQTRKELMSQESDFQLGPRLERVKAGLPQKLLRLIESGSRGYRLNVAKAMTSK